MKSIITVIGTRPEAIKLSSIIQAFALNKFFKNQVCVMYQHTDLLSPILKDLGIIADHELYINVNDDDLAYKLAAMLNKFKTFLLENKPDLIIVQGDTSTAFAAALAAFYAKIPIAHIEAGLRTHQIESPWPEEAHRKFIDQISNYFFAPTLQAKNNLLAEGIEAKRIWIVGNTVIDAAKLVMPHGSSEQNTIIVTLHRRENQKKTIFELCYALKQLALEFPNIVIKFVLHANPTIRESIINLLDKQYNIQLIDSLVYSTFIKELLNCMFIITDSGGIQEEATYLGKPVLVIRDFTERNEGVKLGNLKLVASQKNIILMHCKDLLENRQHLLDMSKKSLIFGDGLAGERIVHILYKELHGANK